MLVWACPFANCIWKEIDWDRGRDVGRGEGKAGDGPALPCSVVVLAREISTQFAAIAQLISFSILRLFSLTSTLQFPSGSTCPCPPTSCLPFLHSSIFRELLTRITEKTFCAFQSQNSFI